MLDADFLWAAFVTLLVTLDPPGLAPIFLSVTNGMTKEQRRGVSVRACLIAFAILLFFGFGGELLLQALGVGLPAFRIAGGILLFYIAFEMIFGGRSERKRETAETAITLDHVRNVAAFPLAIPLMAGPGAITAVILLAGRAAGEPAMQAALVGVIAVGVATCFLAFLVAERVSKLLGVTGNIVLTRLLGVILAALAVQFAVDGIGSLVAG
ncbi:MarC family protein [Salinarimonas sp. NSM]|uniref:MarC family protein n=1 Tax=Salinarimonas sp. NSM TaxID=3458003 RepID=UPI004036C9E3